MKGKASAAKRWGRGNQGVTGVKPEGNRKVSLYSSSSSSSSIKNKTPLPPEGEERDSPFSQFWLAWPKHHRKTSRSKCLERWAKDGLDAKCLHVLAVLAAHKLSEQWTKDGGEFIPAPLAWLNQRQWDCEVSDLGDAEVKDPKHLWVLVTTGMRDSFAGVDLPPGGKYTHNSLGLYRDGSLVVTAEQIKKGGG